MDAALYPDWPAPGNARAFTTLRHGAGLSAPPFDRFNLGARCGDDPQAVAANREELIRHFALPSAPRWLQQVHGTRVVSAESGKLQSNALPLVNPRAQAREGAEQVEPVADAAITATAGVVLAVLTADCLPVLFCADDGSEVGVAHAGWRGLASGVIETTVAAMHTSPDKLLAWLGPAAGPGAYEVGAEVRMAFVESDAVAAGAFVPTRPGHWSCDLYALARRRLHAAGVARIYGGGLCTISDPQRFYSYRRERQTGRMASVIFLQDGADGA